jgi:hypothetical protein
MAGKIIADTIETGAGADISTSYVVNGSAKSWVNFNGTGTIAARDSLNVASLTDIGTGNHEINFSSAMSDVNYSRSTHMQRENATASFANIDGSYNNDTYSTTTLEVRTVFMNDSASGAVDSPIVSNQIFGDLA